MKTVEEHLKLTRQRTESFQMMINHLKGIDNPLIVETGCIREAEDYGAGCSTEIFDQYLNENGGRFYSVDNSPTNVIFAKTQVSNKNTSIVLSDSVAFLKQFNTTLLSENKKIDLLYLDSYDFYEGIEHESSLHHIFELLAISPSLSENTMVVVDDNFEDKGKGYYIKQYMDLIGNQRLYSGYQWIWMWK